MLGFLLVKSLIVADPEVQAAQVSVFDSFLHLQNRQVPLF